MEFTYLEKKAIAKVLFQIMLADGVIEDDELALQKKIASSMEITDEFFIVSAIKFSFDDAIGIIREMKKNKKTDVGQFIAKLIMADGKIDVNESELAATIEKKANISILKYFPKNKKEI